MAQRGQLVHTQQIGGFSIPTAGTIKAYFLVTKPVMVFLLVFTGVVGFTLASQGDFFTTTFILALLALTLGCAGANTLTCYIDRDIDAVMEQRFHGGYTGFGCGNLNHGIGPVNLVQDMASFGNRSDGIMGKGWVELQGDVAFQAPTHLKNRMQHVGCALDIVGY